MEYGLKKTSIELPETKTIISEMKTNWMGLTTEYILQEKRLKNVEK